LVTFLPFVATYQQARCGCFHSRPRPAHRAGVFPWVLSNEVCARCAVGDRPPVYWLAQAAYRRGVAAVVAAGAGRTQPGVLLEFPAHAPVVSLLSGVREWPVPRGALVGLPRPGTFCRPVREVFRRIMSSRLAPLTVATVVAPLLAMMRGLNVETP